MNINYYHIDTFTGKLFSGNPACVCCLDYWLPDKLLQKIAIENSLPVTTFFVPDHSKFLIRWFTPEEELDLCGHGTLAAAAILFKKFHNSTDTIELYSRKSGLLVVEKVNHLINLSVPSKFIVECQKSYDLSEGLGLPLEAVYQYKKERLLAITNSEILLQDFYPNMEFLQKLDYRAVIVTAPSLTVDFASRTFYPKKTIPEDAVTGASHCFLIPYWAKRLGKKSLHAYQLSARGGELFCQDKDDYVVIGGETVLYSEGSILISDHYIK